MSFNEEKLVRENETLRGEIARKNSELDEVRQRLEHEQCSHNETRQLAYNSQVESNKWESKYKTAIRLLDESLGRS